MDQYEIRRLRAKRFQTAMAQNFYTWAISVGIKLSDIPLRRVELATPTTIEGDELRNIKVVTSVEFSEDKMSKSENLRALEAAVKNIVDRIVAHACEVSLSDVEAAPDVYYHECVILAYCAPSSVEIRESKGVSFIHSEFTVAIMAVKTVLTHSIEIEV